MSLTSRRIPSPAHARLVNGQDGPLASTIKVTGFTVGSASALTLTSDARDAENTAAAVDKVAPAALGVQVAGDGVTVALPGSSYSVVTMVAA